MVPKRFHGNAFPVNGGTLEFHTPVKHARLVYPEPKALDLHAENGKTVISLPDFTLQQIIVCEK